ncbi:MAG: sensor histidine kinase [Actinomycetota bacterium]|nr:sensor histidine kinase [Actinomycetota bacterium]
MGPLLSFGTFLAVMLALYSVAAYRDGWQPFVGAAGTAAGVTTIALLDPSPFLPYEWVFPLVYFGGVWTIGRLARARRQWSAGLAERVAQADREREQHVRLATAEERTRIARELHDVVAHSIGVMVVQAEAAEEVLAHDPDRAAAPLVRIQSSGRQALGELRQLLSVLRADADTATLAPQPGISNLPELVEALGETGMRVDLRVEGARRPLPPGLELSAYRIIQEALTNSRKHGGATTADVQVRYGAGTLELRVVDCGLGDGTVSAGGHGLVGMRERVALYGGRLDAGPRAEGGFAVTATLPLDPP